MQVVGSAHRDIVDISAAVAQFGVVAVEEFLLGEEGSLGEVAVHDAHAVAFVVGGDKVVAGVFDGFDVPGSNVATDTDYREVFHRLYLEKQILHKSVTNICFSLCFLGSLLFGLPLSGLPKSLLRSWAG